MKRIFSLVLALLLCASACACGTTESPPLPPASSTPIASAESGGARISAEVAAQLDAMSDGDRLLVAAVINAGSGTVIPTLPEGVDVMLPDPDNPTVYIRGTREQLLALAANPYIDDLLPAPADADTTLIDGFALTVYSYEDASPLTLPEMRLGTQAELDRFLAMLDALDRTLSHAAAGSVPNDKRYAVDCSAEESVRFLTALRALQPEVLPEMHNPYTGGACWAHLYTDEGEFTVGYPGGLLFVSVAGEDVCWLFGISEDNPTADALWGAISEPLERNSPQRPQAQRGLTDGLHITRQAADSNGDLYFQLDDVITTEQGTAALLALLEPLDIAPCDGCTAPDGGFPLVIDRYENGAVTDSFSLHPQGVHDGHCCVWRLDGSRFCISAEQAQALATRWGL